jgi:hypothetical protein
MIDNVGYGKYGNVSLGGIIFLITTHRYLKELFIERLKYENRLVVNGESINDVGLTLGLVANNRLFLM